MRHETGPCHGYADDMERLLIFGLLALPLSCRPLLGTEFEGDDAGECSDGADNDRDGYFDCQDNECWDSPDC